MKSLITTLLAIGIALPTSSAYAMSVNDIIDMAKATEGTHSGSTYVESHASANSGEQVVTGGQTVTTGDSSASAYTETHVNAGSDGGSVHVKVETTENGETKTREYTKPIEKGEGAKVEVQAASNNGVSTSSVRVNDKDVETKADVEAAASTSVQTAAVSAADSPFTSFFSVTIPSIFKKVFAFLWRF